MTRKYIKGKRTAVKIVTVTIIIIVGLFFGVRWQNQTRSPQLPAPALKELAGHHGIELGNFAIRSHLHDKPYIDILTSQFNLALADNTPNWYFTDGGLRPGKSTFDFTHLDEVINFAQGHGMPIQAHHYLWGEEKWLPKWLKTTPYTKNQLDDIIHQHISTVGQHYAGKVQEWSVVNEAFTRGQHQFGLNDWWADHTGSKEYIDKAFVWARQADPNSKLILNDFNNEGINDVSNEMYDYIKSAKERGIPIDGIGMQMHIDGTHPPTKDEVVSNMKRFEALDVAVYVTEFDVNMNDVKASPEGKDATEANIYYDMTRACIESGVCHSFSILGITDRETWYNYLGLPDSRPLPFDKNYKPKPAFYSFRNALMQQ